MILFCIVYKNIWILFFLVEQLRGSIYIYIILFVVLLFQHVDLFSLNLLLVDLEICLTAFVAHRIKKYRTPKKLIEEIDSAPEPQPRCPPGKIKIHVRLSSQQQQQQQVVSGPAPLNKSFPLNVTTARVGTSPLIKTLTPQTSTGQGKKMQSIFSFFFVTNSCCRNVLFNGASPRVCSVFGIAK